MSDTRRSELVRERFAAVAEEFLALVDQHKSGHVLVHFQHGVPGKVEWRMGGEIVRRRPEELTGANDR